MKHNAVESTWTDQVYYGAFQLKLLELELQCDVEYMRYNDMNEIWYYLVFQQSWYDCSKNCSALKLLVCVSVFYSSIIWAPAHC